MRGSVWSWVEITRERRTTLRLAPPERSLPEQWVGLARGPRARFRLTPPERGRFWLCLMVHSRKSRPRSQILRSWDPKMSGVCPRRVGICRPVRSFLLRLPDAEHPAPTKSDMAAASRVKPARTRSIVAQVRHGPTSSAEYDGRTSQRKQGRWAASIGSAARSARRVGQSRRDPPMNSSLSRAHRSWSSQRPAILR
jgi:hypothetical protein